ncbi:MAG: hypothetical protein AB7Q17_14320 [Phycisphaerae bacterium]
MIRTRPDDAVQLPPTPFGNSVAASLCPIDRLPSRRRKQICVLVMFLGFVNFLLYALLYASLGGDAPNGHAEHVVRDDGTRAPAYFVRGHFLRTLTGKEREVSRSWWIYSYVHSISVLLTSGAMVVSMLVLARPHILAVMQDSWIRGPTFILAFGGLVSAATVVAVLMFTWDFVEQLLAL